MISAYRIKRTDTERMGQAMIQDHLDDLAALAETHPATVSHAHFMKRDLAAAVEAGLVTVTMPHPMFSTVPGVPVVDVRHTDDGRGFVLVTADRSEFKRYAKGVLTVTWHELGDDWKKLTRPMQYALRYLAGDAPATQPKPRKNTLKALESRSHWVNGQLTPRALALYRQHKQELGNG